MILTARIADEHLAFFRDLRRAHFPAARNYLDAHLTVFHNISDRHLAEMIEVLGAVAELQPSALATVVGVRHLGRGVAFEIECMELGEIRSGLRRRFEPWLIPQDLQGWRPHITVQNGVAKEQADGLHAELTASFEARTLLITGLDLWHYRGGPWQAEASFAFSAEAKPSSAGFNKP
jgi:hypothetical protein